MFRAMPRQGRYQILDLAHGHQVEVRIFDAVEDPNREFLGVGAARCKLDQYTDDHEGLSQVEFSVGVDE